ncbi:MULTISPECIES: DHA2 family efflux MFS transporter permease subunit [unclassified Streptomyces]|uniref:DHA2 family efflux MFS transporter permease subunit n=1 Tax=unclassified Streptomyces TaxID=2593676 RepID=UPI002ED55128|nr:DHA2 family efflux MFS transporter permease subunit [Streptomyces sp. NBC_00891]WSY03930.1 DHA2 family efflux MFS transporter permease subunit [Streptomyces sp. NBC_00890]WSZ05556.1 DHA2 family efflux MFS transporter permease subunit [Streptomyces sp. NBC_00869]WSZ26948.1 DHA2 family efflux MFS transporter permease subunit [Streptomyces sp. NBC_00870]
MTEQTASPAERVDRELLRIAFILVLGTFMASLDATIVSVGLDRLTEEFDASVAEIQWVSTAYLLAIVAAVPASGWLAGRFGGRRTWIAAVGLFLIGSVLCASAWSATSLIVFRVIQGIGGGLLPATGQALLARVAGPGRTGKVISIVAVVPLLSPVFGPLAGGSVLAVASWPWLFLINLPIGVAAVLLARRYVPVVPPASQRTAFDLRGALLLSPGLAVLVYGLTEVAHDRMIPATIGVVAGVVMLTAFTVHGLRTRGTPLVDPRLFARPPFGAAALALVVLGASVFGTMFLLPLYFQSGRGMSAWEAGLLLAPQGLGAAAGSVLVNRTITKVAPRTLVVTGIVLILAGTAPFTLLGHGVPDAVIAAALVVRGFGMSMIGAPVMNIVYSRIEPEQLPRAAGALNLLNTVGGSVGTAALAVILQDRLAARGTDIAAAFGDTFWWVLGFCLFAAAAATRLPRTQPRKG